MTKYMKVGISWQTKIKKYILRYYEIKHAPLKLFIGDFLKKSAVDSSYKELINNLKSYFIKITDSVCYKPKKNE